MTRVLSFAWLPIDVIIRENKMATTSFKKEFIVKDRSTADRLTRNVEGKIATVSYTKKNSASDKRKGESLLARLVSA
jgi:hypothetical protein